MWRAGIRAAMTLAFSLFGRKVIALVAMVVMLFTSSVLYDLKMYVSGGLAFILSVVALLTFAIQYRRQLARDRVRARQQVEAAERRAAAAGARTEKMGRAKAAVADTVAGAAEAARTGFSGAKDRVQGWRKQPNQG
jgi:membrane protein implicated in regulation of membrane protease activity